MKPNDKIQLFENQRILTANNMLAVEAGERLKCLA